MTDDLRTRIAAVLTAHTLAPVKYPLPYRCRCGWTENDNGYGIGTLQEHPAHVADKLIRELPELQPCPFCGLSPNRCDCLRTTCEHT